MVKDRTVNISSSVARQILAYLVKNPDAGGTLESIVEWWLTQNEINWRVTEVQATLTTLVSEGWICERGIPSQMDGTCSGHDSRQSTSTEKGKGKRKVYRINKVKMQEIKSLLNPEMDANG